MRWLRPASAALFAVALLLLAPGARAQSVADFYRGKQISWILSADAGGGYSSYALTFAPYLTAHLPGNPKIIVQNMPGAGGLRAPRRHHHRHGPFQRAVRAALRNC